MIDGEICDYAFDRKSIIETEKIIKDLEENNKLGTKLDSIMLQLIKRTTNTAVAAQVQEESRPPITKSKSTGTRNITRTIVPRYSFLNWGITTPQDHLIIAYGRVYVTNKQSVAFTLKNYLRKNLSLIIILCLQFVFFRSIIAPVPWETRHRKHK